MINVTLHVEDKCQNCPNFMERVTVNKRYADNTMYDTNIHIFCEHTNLCRDIEYYLRGGDSNN